MSTAHDASPELVAGEELRAARLASGLTLEAVARAYGSRRQNVAAVEARAVVGPRQARRYIEAVVSAVSDLLAAAGE